MRQKGLRQEGLWQKGLRQEGLRQKGLRQKGQRRKDYDRKDKEKTMIRKANAADISAVADIYEEIHTEEEAGRASIGWVRGVYPTEETARAAVMADDLYVLEEEGRIAAAARINRQQVAEYANADWKYAAKEEEVLVLHTLVVSPSVMHQGYGKEFVRFYEQLAVELHCPYLRMDTNARNERARKFYKKMGYREAGIVPCTFNGIEGVQLVCLEKNVQEDSCREKGSEA